MKILVTGGCGFIGSAVCRQLVMDGFEVVNLDKLTYAATPGSTAQLANFTNYRFIQGDIVDANLVGEIFASCRPEAVIHLAAESHVDRSINNSQLFIETNVLGTHTLINAALFYWQRLDAALASNFRFLHVSTDEVYGSLGPEGCFSEETPYDPRSPYSSSKAASDHLVKAWFHTYGLPTLVSNCSNNYGPFHFPEKLIPLSITKALRGERLPVYGDGGQVRDWLHVDDHARALRLILDRGRPGQTYNIGGRNERTNLQVVERICEFVDQAAKPLQSGPRRGLIQFVADRPGHDRRYAIDATKLETELLWKARYRFEDGLKETVSWFLANEWWWRPLLANDRTRLPLSKMQGSS